MRTSITRHPDGANLMSYAAGTLPEPLATAVAAHALLCRDCRVQVRDLQSLGGVLLEDLGAGELRAIRALPGMQKLAEIAANAGGPGIPRDAVSDAVIPAAIARRFGFDPAHVPWRWLAPGVRYVPLTPSPRATGDLRLLKIAPGCKMPEHGHGGCEMTLVLDGAYRDETGQFRRGDIQDVDGELEHQPIVDKLTGCVCLVAAERPARFKGVFSRLLQPWTGM